MNNQLDEELRALRAESPPARLHQLEAHVWRQIARQGEAAISPQAIFALRAAAVAAALGLGIAGGGLTAVAVASEPQEVSVFSVRAQLAPSTLLDHHE